MTEKQKILIVDDKKENLIALRHVLSGMDVELVEATSGNQALAATFDHQFAVAILDVQMPGMSGYELAEHLRGDEKTIKIPILFLTAHYGGEQDIFKGYEAGGIDYLTKPYSPEVLRGKLKIFLEIDRYRRGLEILVAERTRELEQKLVEQKAAEEEKQVLQLRFQQAPLQSAIFNSANFSSIATDANGVIQLFNVGAERMLGYSAIDVMNKITPADISDPQEIIDRAEALTIELGTPITPGFEALVFKASRGIEDIYELTYIRKDGSRFPAVVSVTALRDAQNAIIGYLLIGSDNSARKRAEEEMRRLNREQRAITNCNQLMMRAEDEQTLLNQICCIICGEAGYRMAWVGYPENDEGKTIRPVARAGTEDGYLEHASLTWADTELGRGPSGTAIRSGHTACIQDFATEPQAAPWRDRALQQGYHSSIVLPLKDDSAKTFGVLNIYSSEPNSFSVAEMRLLEELSRDLAFGIMVLRARTDRTQFESERQQLAQRLRDQQFYTRSLFESSIDPMITTDPDGIITDVNKQMELLTDCTRDELIGAPFMNYFTDPARAEASINLVLSKKTVTNYELTARARDGKETLVSYNATTFYDRDRKLQGVFAAARDVTERTIMDKALKEKNVELEAVNKEMEDFAYSVSHDLRAPLRVIDGFSRKVVINYGERLDDEGRRQLQVVRDNAQRMGQMIDNLLAFSRMGRCEILLQPLDMDAMVNGVVEELRAAEPERSIEFSLSPLPCTLGDAAMMRQVWTNLLSNAVKFTRQRQTAHIEICGREEGGELHYWVKDDGAGFDMQYAEKLFGVFQRLHRQDEFEGTGVGLAIVQRILHRHNGRIWAEGMPDESATLHFALPLPAKNNQLIGGRAS